MEEQLVNPYICTPHKNNMDNVRQNNIHWRSKTLDHIDKLITFIDFKTKSRVINSMFFPPHFNDNSENQLLHFFNAI